MSIRKALAVGSVFLLGMVASQRECSAQLATNPGRYTLNRPTVSPYLNLLRRSADNSSLPNYQTLVRPQLEQRQQSQQRDIAIQRLQSRVTNMQGRAAIQAQQQGRRNPFITGHASGFMRYLHYYPSMGARRR